MKLRSKSSNLAWVAVMATLTLTTDYAFAQDSNRRIEPTAGSWKTWVLSSGRELEFPRLQISLQLKMRLPG